MDKRGKFVIVDGLDGVGKGEVIRAIVEYEQGCGRSIFDVNSWWGTDLSVLPLRDYNPRVKEIVDDPLIVTSEPTFAGVGRRIRLEYIYRNTRDYDPRVIAEAYALDRHELYTTTIVPFLELGLDIIQSRGIITSLVYQIFDSQSRSAVGITIDELLALPGNAYAMRFAPSLLIIPTVLDFDLLQQRLALREKKDNAIFESVEFQRQLKPVYESAWLRELFENAGSKVAYLDAGMSVEETRRQAVELWKME